MSDTSAVAPQKSRMGLVVAASAAGTVFEWYDFFIFGSLAAIIAKHFFAGAGETQSYILALLTFAAGFAARPFGALFFGRLGDRTGRKRTFLVTITLMGLATFVVGFLPDANAIGLAAPYALVALRVFQGFAIGGEYGGAAIYVAEHAAPNRRGLATGWIQIAASLGLILALVVILVTRRIMGEDVFGAWGWRIPFLLSAILLVISLWIRLKLHESPLFQRIQQAGELARTPLREAFFHWANLKLVLVALFGVLMGQGVVWYAAQFYTQFFLERVLKLDGALVNELIIAVTISTVPFYVFFSWLSDRIGRKPIMLVGLLVAAVCYFPGFQMLTKAVNPAMAEAAARAPASVVADPADCTVQFDILGQAKYVSSCDIAKSALTKAGVAYRNEAASDGAYAHVHIGTQDVESPDGHAMNAADLAAAKKDFDVRLQSALKAAGYPAKADPNAVDIPRAFIVLMIFGLAAAALYAPQAAALVELFPTRIRYSALSVPYHIGVGWFGGFLPATAFAIVAATGNIYAGLWYPAIVASIGFFVTLLFLPETYKRTIE